MSTVNPKVPRILRQIPDALEAVTAPVSDIELKEISRIRSLFRLEAYGEPYSVDYARAFRLARGKSTYMEVGSRDKGTLAWLTRILTPDATIIDIDLEHIPEATSRLQKFLKPQQKYFQVEGNSVSDETLEKIGKILGGRRADIIFLDSSHVFSHFLDEFGKYWDLLADDGVMLVHDIFWEGNAAQKGKAQVAEIIDRYIPVYSIFMNDPPSRFFRRATNKDVWGGFGIIPK